MRVALGAAGKGTRAACGGLRGVRWASHGAAARGPRAGEGQEQLQGRAEQVKIGGWGNSFCRNGNKREMGTTYPELRLTTAGSVESFSKCHLVSKNLHGGIVPIKAVSGNPAREVHFFQVKA